MSVAWVEREIGKRREEYTEDDDDGDAGLAAATRSSLALDGAEITGRWVTYDGLRGGTWNGIMEGNNKVVVRLLTRMVRASVFTLRKAFGCSWPRLSRARQTLLNINSNLSL